MEKKRINGRYKTGFTLIELLVVIAIIGILSAIGLTTLHGARERARDAKRKSDFVQIRTALTMFYDDNNEVYPGPGTTQYQAEDMSVRLNGKLVTAYLSKAITDDGNAATGYYYAYASDGDVNVDNAKTYALLAHLEGSQQTKIWILNSKGRTGEFSRVDPAPGAETDYSNYECRNRSGHMNVCVDPPIIIP